MTIRQNLTIYEGQDWSFTYTHLPTGVVDITGFSARMAIRRGPGLSLQAYLSTGSDADGGSIALGGVAGTVIPSMTAVQTDALVTSLDLVSLKANKALLKIEPFVYDLELVNASAVVLRVLEGKLFLHRSVTE